MLYVTLMNSSTASVVLNGGADSDEEDEDEDDEPVDYSLGNLIAIGPTKSGKTTAINNLLLNPCFGNLARYNIICSDGGWTTQDQRPKIAVLRPLLYPAAPYQGSTP